MTLSVDESRHGNTHENLGYSATFRKFILIVVRKRRVKIKIKPFKQLGGFGRFSCSGQ